MIVPDVNLLLYAYFPVFSTHDSARVWWEDLAQRQEPVGITPPVAFGFVRISTQRRIFASPMGAQRAMALVEEWRALPHVHLLRPGPRHLELAFGLLRAAATTRDLTTDAQIAVGLGRLGRSSSSFGL